MPSALPIADPAPADGLLPATVADGWGDRAFGVYVHVPFCKVRCGYCDFNTYTAAEIRGVEAERLRRARRSPRSRRPRACSRAPARRPARRPRSSSAAAPPPCCRSPTSRACSPASGAPGASRPAPRSRPRRTPTRSTSAASPSSPRPASPASASGCSRRCRTCSRRSSARTTPSGSRRSSRWARAAGPAGQPRPHLRHAGRDAADWQASLDLAIAQQPDHLSAYALIVEPGTKLARQISRGEVAAARRRPRRRPVRAGRCDARRRRIRLVRGQQLGSGCGGTGHATTSPTGRARTGGASAPERTATSAACAGGT